MEKVTAHYANRVAGALDDAIVALKRCPQLHASNLDIATNLSIELESLRNQITDTLSRTLEQDESLRSDIRKYDCEWSTKNEELKRQQARLNVVREERKERRMELENELQEVTNVFHEKEYALSEELTREEEHVDVELGDQRKRFQVELEALQKKRDELRTQYEDQRRQYDQEESRMKALNASVVAEIQNLSRDFEVQLNTKESEIKAGKVHLEEQMKRRKELEEHFDMINKNNAEKQQELDALDAVCELERKAAKLLDNGAIQFQKLYRGFVAKLKAGKSKKKGGKKKGGKAKKNTK